MTAPLAVYATWDDAALAAIASPGLVRRAAKLAADAAWQAPAEAATVTVEVGQFEVLLDGRGPQRGRCPCPAAGMCAHLLAAAMALRDQGPWQAGDAGVEGPKAVPTGVAKPLPGATPAGNPSATVKVADGPTAKTRAATEAVRQEVSRLIRAGLAHVSGEAPAALRDLIHETRSAGLVLLGKQLGSAATQAEALATGRDDVSELELTSALARLWALTEALDLAGPETWPKLKGQSRRSFEMLDAVLRCDPLGASWNVTASGARVLTLYVWADGEIWRAVSARPRGSDPSFWRSDLNTGLWSTPLNMLLSGPFELRGAKSAEDGTLSAAADSARRLEGKVDQQVLDAASAVRLDARSGAFGRPFGAAVVLAVSGIGSVQIDEVAQQVVWTLPTADKRVPVTLRQAVTPDTQARVDRILALHDDRARIAYVVAEHTQTRGRAHLAPVAAWGVGKRQLTLVSFDFEPTRRTEKAGALRKTLALSRRRWAAKAVQPVETRSAVERCCDDTRDLMVQLTATGRAALSADQLRRQTAIAERCDALALTTLAAAIRRIASRPNPGDLLRAHHLADRLAEAAP